MGYVEQNLMPNEKIVLKARLHWGMFVGPASAAAIGVLLAVLSLVISAISQDEDIIYVGIFSAFCCAGPILLSGLASLTSAVISYLTTEFAVTDRRIIAKSGLIRRQSLELMISKVESIGINQTFWGRLLNYGTIVVSGSGGTKQGFSNIADPMALRQRINAQIASKSQA